MPRLIFGRVVLCTVACMAWPGFSAHGKQLPSQQTASQQTSVANRLIQPIDESNLTTLKGNTHPLARREFDRGPAPPSLPLDRMLLVLGRSAEQETALETLLDQQQDKNSPNYHAWLTPEQFGQQFGPSDDDTRTITSWLESQGFSVNRVSKGRTTIEFSGTHAQLQQAFHTEIHKYSVNGEDHWANSSDPQIPVALAPVVAGIKTLHNFYKHPQILITDEKFRATSRLGQPPEFTSTTGLHALAPGDYAKIYNITPLYTAGTTGGGTTIAVVGRSDFVLQDVIDFRNSFGLSSNTPQVIVNGQDPGTLNQGEQFEATLDVTWSGAVAPNAQVIFVVSASTNTTDGLDLSEQYIIDNDLANVMTESFSGCESGATTADANSVSSLAQQAAAEGISYIVSTGDSGAEGCDNPNTETRATGPVSVNILASSPYTIGVGGTEFNDEANPSKYWNTSNSGSLSSALSYIPENVWNESCISGCGQKGGGAIWAGGGGESTLFKKPSWQSGVIPADTNRDLPDVSLTAAGHDPYLLCFQYSCEGGGFYGVGGTSASAPSFAGIMALVNQKTGSRQGQANYVLYRLAAGESLSQCNASNTTTLPASGCIFSDVTVGNNAVPGETGYGTTSADYQSTAGYDRATGLGSVNVANLVNKWNTARSVASAITVSVTPSTTVTHGTPLDFSISVAAAPPGTGSPTGDVALIGDFGSSPSGETEIANLTLNDSTINSNAVNNLPGGSHNLQVHYEGDGTFTPSDTTVKVTINPEASTETAAALTGTPPNLTTFTTQPYGVPIYLQSKVAGKSGVGVPSGNVNFSDSVRGLLDSASLNPSGTATTFGITESAGSYFVTATYLGDSSFQGGTSSSVGFTVTTTTTTTQILPPNIPLVEGQGPQLIVYVNANSYGTTPTGSVAAFVSGKQVGSPVQVAGILTGGPTVTSDAYIPLSTLPPGPATITVSYSGDSNYQASASTPVTVNILRSTSISLSSSAPTIQATQSVTVTAVVTPGQSGPTMTGSVQFFVNQGPVGSPVTLSNGQAQFTTSSLRWGTDTLAAVYSGDPNYAVSESSLISETVNPIASATAVVSSNPSVPQGQNVSFTATVTSSKSGEPTPTGGVNFIVGGSAYTVGLNTSGQAVWTINDLPLGNTVVTAAYQGDQVYSGSSANITQTITATPSFSISDNSPTVNVSSPGQSGSTMITFTAQNGFTGSAALTSAMCVGLPSESSCSFNPSTINLTAQTTSQTVTLTVNTTAPGSTVPSSRRFTPGIWRNPSELALLWTLCIALILLAHRASRRRATTVLALALFAAILTVASCGGGSYTGPPPPPPNPGTPTGQYHVSVTVTMNGVTQTINNILLNVQ